MEWSHPVTSCNSSSLCCCSGLVMTSPCVNERSASKSAVCINGRIIILNEWIIKEIHPTHPPSSSTQHFWWLDSWVLLNIYKPVMLLLWGPGIYISTYIKPLGLWPPPPLCQRQRKFPIFHSLLLLFGRVFFSVRYCVPPAYLARRFILPILLAKGYKTVSDVHTQPPSIV